MQTNKGNMVVWVLIVLVVVAILVFLTIKVYRNNPTTENVGTEVGTTAPVTGEEVGNTIATNEEAKAGDIVTVNYTGKLADGTVFDSSVDPKFGHVEPFSFPLGVGQVIAGWDKGIVGMKVGDKKTLVIAPEDAYGAKGAGGVIPPNATLTFDVQVLKITSGTAVPTQ